MVTIDPIQLKIWQDQNLEYLRYSYDLKPEDKVLDIGSYRREWADKIIKDFGCHVECFDALDNKAAWVFNGKLQMGGAYYYTSMYETATTEYWCVDIAPYLQEEIALVKINIEGGEFRLLDYIMEIGCIKNIKDLQVQFHYIDGYDSKRAYELLAKRLSVTHNLVWQYPFCWESWARKEYKTLICKEENGYEIENSPFEMYADQKN